MQESVFERYCKRSEYSSSVVDNRDVKLIVDEFKRKFKSGWQYDTKEQREVEFGPNCIIIEVSCGNEFDDGVGLHEDGSVAFFPKRDLKEVILTRNVKRRATLQIINYLKNSKGEVKWKRSLIDFDRNFNSSVKFTLYFHL